MTKSIDRRIGRIAGAQRGVVTRAQLIAAGETPSEIKRRLADGRLYLLHRGVYSVGHGELTPAAWHQAALLAVDGGVLSHLSAGAVWRWVQTWPVQPHVTIARRGGRVPNGITLHRVRAMPEVRERNGLRVTTPARTLLDLAEILGTADLRRAIRQAEFDHLVTHDQLLHLLTRHPGRHGARRLKEALDGGATPTRSDLEDRFLDLIDKAGLERPEMNARVHHARVDFLWPRQRVIVETDGWDGHSGRIAFEDDRERDQRLLAAGYVVMRVTWRQLTKEPTKTAARLAALLAARDAVGDRRQP
jgi:very-short-patch-repair endonuclease